MAKSWRNRLASILDINGNLRPEFRQVFDLIEAHDPSVAGNYERFLEWSRLLLDVPREPFRRIIEVKLDRLLIDTMGHLRGVFTSVSGNIGLASALPASPEPSPCPLPKGKGE
jgi:hypothetical protein